MNPFLFTVSIVAGVLLPVAVLVALWLIADTVRLIREAWALRVERERKKPPFDTVESSMSFEDNVLHIRLVKKGDVIYTGRISRRELEQ